MKTLIRKLSNHPHLPILKKIFVFCFFVLVAVLIFNRLKELSWNSVWQALKDLQTGELALSLGLAFVGHAFYSSYDLLARAHLKHSLSKGLTATIAHISYAFNLNLGALIGGAGFRFRLYSRAGLNAAQISGILAFSVLTNWLGYMLLLGLLLIFQEYKLPSEWEVSTGGLKAIGGVGLFIPTLYLLFSAFARKRKWAWGRFELTLPSVKISILQIFFSSASWLVIGLLIFLLLGQSYSFTLVGFVVLVAAIAGALTHVPAGLGVLEYVFLTLLTGAMSSEKLVAYLLVYRFVYYLVPLAVAVGSLLAMESRGRQANK